MKEIWPHILACSETVSLSWVDGGEEMGNVTSGGETADNYSELADSEISRLGGPEALPSVVPCRHHDNNRSQKPKREHFMQLESAGKGSS